MPLRNLNRTWPAGRILGTPKAGVIGSLIPSTGTHGPGYIFGSLSLPAENDDQFQGYINTVPVGLTLYAFEDSSFTASGADGTYVTGWTLYKNGVLVGPTTFTVSLGNVAFGRADETDTAFALASVQIRPVGRADETDTAFAPTGTSMVTVGRADETDTAFALTGRQIGAMGRADESDDAFALLPLGFIGVAEETDVAFALASVQIKPVGRADETDTAFALGGGQAVIVGLAVETDTAFALAGVQIKQVGLAIEIDTAFALNPVQALIVGLSLEIDTAFALLALQKMLVGMATETDTAYTPSATAGGLDPVLRLTVTIAAEYEFISTVGAATGRIDVLIEPDPSMGSVTVG